MHAGWAHDSTTCAVLDPDPWYLRSHFIDDNVFVRVVGTRGS